MEYNTLPPPSSNASRKLKRKRGESFHSTNQIDEFVPVSKKKPIPPAPRIQVLRYDALHPPTFRIPFRMVDFTVTTLRIPGLSMSTVATMDPKLCRENFTIIMEQIYYRKLLDQRTVEIQFIKKPKSILNKYCLMFGQVMNPIYDVPDTLTVFVQLRSRRIVRVPLDHFRIVQHK